MKRHPPEAWAEARRMVVQDGAAYAEAARETGISASSIQKRAARDNWQAARESSMSYAATIRALKARLLEKAMEAMADDASSKDAAQLVYAWKQAEAAYPEHRYQVGATKEDPKLRRQVLLECIEGLVEYFTAEDRNVLAAIQPHLRGFATFMEARSAA